MKLTGRQGDVAFIKCRIPKDAKRVPLRPFAYGETTGHSHRVCVADEEGVEMYECEAGVFLRVTKDGVVSLVHEDHDPVGTISVLPKGWEGEVRIKREYDEEEEWRRITD